VHDKREREGEGERVSSRSMAGVEGYYVAVVMTHEMNEQMQAQVANVTCVEDSTAQEAETGLVDGAAMRTFGELGLSKSTGCDIRST